MLDCTDCGRCPTIHFMGDIAPRVLCERAQALADANEAAHRATVAAVTLADVLAELQALRRVSASVGEALRRWDAEGLPARREAE